MEIPDKTLKALIAEHESAGKLLRAALECHQALEEKLKSLLASPDPQPEKRRNLKQERIDDYAADVAAGKWSKPVELRKTPKKKS